MKRQVWLYLALAFAISWTVWLIAQKLGVSPGNGEYFLSFGSAGPALAAIILSRRQAGTVAQNPLSRLTAVCFFWLVALMVYLFNDQFRGINIHVPRNNYLLVVFLLALLPA